MPLPRVISTIEDQIDSYAPADDIYSALNHSLFYLVQSSELLPRWPSKERDKKLQQIAVENNHLSGLVSLATSKLVNIPLTFIPRDPTISAHADRAVYFSQLYALCSEYGKGSRRAHRKMIADYLTLDNGGFLEVLEEGGPSDPAGPLLRPACGVRHLDAMLVERTGNPKYPITYEENGDRYKFHWSRVIDMVQQPSGRRAYNETGLSCISRSFELGQVLRDQLVYKLEKMGSRPANQIVVGKNIESQEIIKTFLMAEQLMDAVGLERYAKVVAMGGADVEVDKIDLNNFEPFDEETGTRMAIYALAYIWGLDIRDIWPEGGGGKGEQIANMKARGRLPADYTGDFADQLDLKVAPPYLKAQFDFQDDEQDQMTSVNRDIRSRQHEREAKLEILDREAIQRQMVIDGDLPREEFIRQQLENGKLEDGRPVSVLFYSDDQIIRALCTLEGVPDPLLFSENDPQQIRRAVYQNKAKANELMASTRSLSQIRRAQQALAALDWLLKEYDNIELAMRFSENDGEGPEDSEEDPEVTGGEPEGEEEDTDANGDTGEDGTEKSLIWRFLPRRH